MKLRVLITAFKEPESVAETIKNLLLKMPNSLASIFVTAPDDQTLASANTALKNFNCESFLFKDAGQGKVNALNGAIVEVLKKSEDEDFVIFTDGDVLVDQSALSEIDVYILKNPDVDIFSCRPLSLDTKESLFGFMGHFLADTAHKKRVNGNFLACSGYLYAVRVASLRQILSNKMLVPSGTLSDDAYISFVVLKNGGKLGYCPKATVFVKYPRTLSDWLKQKTRSVGGYAQLKSMGLSFASERGFFAELKDVFLPFLYSKNLREILYSFAVVFLRFVLWVKIFINKITKKDLGSKGWERIESTK